MSVHDQTQAVDTRPHPRLGKRIGRISDIVKAEVCSRSQAYLLPHDPHFAPCFFRIGRAIRVDLDRLEALLADGGSSEPIRARARRRSKAARGRA